MILYGLDPEESCNDPAVLRECIDLLKLMVANLKGMDRAQRKMLEIQEHLLDEQREKMEIQRRQIELLERMTDTQRNTIEQYQVAFSAEHFNDVRRLN